MQRANQLSAMPPFRVRDDDQGNQSSGSHSTYMLHLSKFQSLN
ncbi:hypothetical protein PspLS_10567 [Pyricularia sp. CBS 133598]|nr:hypothetical protein PspLS_10567 [Pyricularia sp. CBS 133598]